MLKTFRHDVGQLFLGIDAVDGNGTIGRRRRSDHLTEEVKMNGKVLGLWSNLGHGSQQRPLPFILDKYLTMHFTATACDCFGLCMKQAHW